MVGSHYKKLDTWLTPENLELVKGWCRDGATRDELAQHIGISTDKLYRWMKMSPELKKAVLCGAEVADRQVEHALFRRALGYSYDEVTQEADPTGTLRISKVVRKEVLPDTKAQIFWLKNRKPATWRDRKQVDVGKSVPETVAEIAKAIEEMGEGDE